MSDMIGRQTQAHWRPCWRCSPPLSELCIHTQGKVGAIVTHKHSPWRWRPGVDIVAAAGLTRARVRDERTHQGPLKVTRHHSLPL